MARTDPGAIASRERACRALALRREGTPFDTIARETGYNSPQAAHMAVSRALKALTREAAADLARLELERLDALLAAVWPNAVGGDLPAVDRCIRLSERRSKLCGLDGRALPRADLPASMAAAVAARATAGGDGQPDPHHEAIARLDCLAELAWPAATAGDLTALGRLVDIATARAHLTGADQAPPESAQPDSVKALVAVLVKARAASSDPLPESEANTTSIDAL